MERRVRSKANIKKDEEGDALKLKLEQYRNRTRPVNFSEKMAFPSKAKYYERESDNEALLGNKIMYFAFSEKEQRLGAVISDGSISLWDAGDDFRYEKNIQSKYVSIWIHYIEFMECWISCDKGNNLYFWNISEGVPTDIFPLAKESKGVIIQATEIPTQKLLIIATSDKYIIVFDPFKMKVKLSVLMAKGGIKDIVYFHTYQSL